MPFCCPNESVRLITSCCGLDGACLVAIAICIMTISISQLNVDFFSTPEGTICMAIGMYATYLIYSYGQYLSRLGMGDSKCQIMKPSHIHAQVYGFAITLGVAVGFLINNMDGRLQNWVGQVQQGLNNLPGANQQPTAGATQQPPTGGAPGTGGTGL